MDIIPFNPLQRKWLEVGDGAIKTFEAIGADSNWILGPRVREFENSLCRYWQQAHAVGVASGLDAIEIALRCLGIKPGDKVLTTPLSAFATTLAILHAQAQPIFVDVDENGLMDLEYCEEALRVDSRIRFVLPVHLYGRSLDLDHLETIQKRYEVNVVEDCAQCIGAQFNGRPAGTVGRMAAVSFYPTKNLGAFGDAGALLTADQDLADRARVMRDYGQQDKYLHTIYGLNSRMDELHAGILNDVLLPRLPVWTERRRRVAEIYIEGIKNPSVSPLHGAPTQESAWHLFPVLVKGSRERFQQHMKSLGIETAVHYPRLIPEQPVMDGLPIRTHGNLDRAGRIARQEVSLPLHPWLQDGEIARVLEACRSWIA